LKNLELLDTIEEDKKEETPSTTLKANDINNEPQCVKRLSNGHLRNLELLDAIEKSGKAPNITLKANDINSEPQCVKRLSNGHLRNLELLDDAKEDY